METIIIKRDGREKSFNSEKIFYAIKRSVEDAYPDKSSKEINEFSRKIEESVCDNIKQLDVKKIKVEKVQDIIEKCLKENDKKALKAFSQYRKERTITRETKSDIMKTINKIGVETDRDNANVGNNFSAKLLRIASESNKWSVLANMPKEMAKLHEQLDLYYHDLDSFNLTLNCLHIPTGKVLKNTFNTGYGTLNVPKRIESAAELSCILLQSTQNDMFGGQSHPNFDNDLSDYVEPTREEIKKEYYSILDQAGYSSREIEEFIEDKLKSRVNQAMQAVVYNLNTMHARAGSQVPFSSVNIGIPKNKDAALVCQCFLEEYEKGLGMGEQPIFPNIIFRVKEGVNREKDDEYYYLYKLACRVASKRMNPTFMNIDSDFNKEYYDKGIIPATMGCRTYVMSNINGEDGVEGRGNNAPTTINLPRIGILAQKDINKFFEILDLRLQQARESLLYRYEVLKHLRVKDLPFVIGQGLMVGSEGLNPDDSIEEVMKNGTWGIGFIGLAETLTALTGKHHGESKESAELGIKIIQHIRNFCDKYKQLDKMNWSCYATPAEGLSGKFVPVDRKMFGLIPGVTDKEYYTNSYHVPVGFNISIKDKIQIEAPYHKLCNAGHISYVELDDYPTPEVIEKIVTNAYKTSNISYIGINFSIRYCKHCGEYLRTEQNCPKCGSYDIQGVSRVTGYLSLNERFGPPKAAERKDRISHNRNDNYHAYTK